MGVFHFGESRLIGLELELDLIVESQIVVLLIVGDDFVGVEISVLKFLMVAAALEGVAGGNEPGHFLVELADSEQVIDVPSLLLVSHFVLVEFNVDNILSVLFFAPFAVLLPRNVLLLLLGTPITLIVRLAYACRLELLTIFHYPSQNQLQYSNSAFPLNHQMLNSQTTPQPTPTPSPTLSLLYLSSLVVQLPFAQNVPCSCWAELALNGSVQGSSLDRLSSETALFLNQPAKLGEDKAPLKSQLSSSFCNFTRLESQQTEHCLSPTPVMSHINATTPALVSLSKEGFGVVWTNPRMS